MTHQYDIAIINGTICDGSGAETYPAQVGIKGDVVVEISSTTLDADRVIDAKGKIVAPGFIDIHTHTDFTILRLPQANSKITQGVTTEVVGNCGFSPAPVRTEKFEDYLDYMSNTVSLTAEEKVLWRWSTMTEFVEYAARCGISVNLVPLIGYGTLRVAYAGFPRETRPLSEGQQSAILRHIEREFEGGIWGLSTALEYAPCSDAEQGELIQACAVVAKHGGIYATHMRQENGPAVFASIDEALEVARCSGVELQISHLKASGQDMWGRGGEILARLATAHDSGLPVGADQYPYPAYGASILDFMPTELLRLGRVEWVAQIQTASGLSLLESHMHSSPDGPHKMTGWGGVRVAAVKSGGDRWAVSKTIKQLAVSRGTSPERVVTDLLIEHHGEVKLIITSMDERDICEIMRHPLVMIGSDGRAVCDFGQFAETHPHPRYYGTFPRILARYVRDKGVLTLPEAIRKMTGMPAQRIGLRGRGVLAEGSYADIVVFDADAVCDMATFDAPHQYSTGIEQVIVNGVHTVVNGELKPRFGGRYLRKGIDGTTAHLQPTSGS